MSDPHNPFVFREPLARFAEVCLRPKLRPKIQGENMRQRANKIVLALSFALLLSPAMLFAQDAKNAGEVLTNDQVITMVKAGLSTPIIVNKIRSSKTNFNTSTDELIRLKQARIPDEIVNAMFEASTHTSAVSSTMGAGDVSKADPNDPSSAHEAGIYLLEEKDGQRKMIQLEPSVSKQTKSGG